MTDWHVVDLKQKLIEKKIKEGPSYVCCIACGDEEAGFAVRGRFNDQGAYFVEKLICLSPACAGDSEIDLIGGFVV